jgi:FecR protein
MMPPRLETLWARWLTHDALGPTEELELWEALRADPTSRAVLLHDDRLDRMLRTLARCQKTEDAFVAAVMGRLQGAPPASDGHVLFLPPVPADDVNGDWYFTVVEPDLDVQKRRRWLPVASLLMTAAAVAVAVLSLAAFRGLPGQPPPGPTAEPGPGPTEMRNTVARLTRLVDAGLEGGPQLGSRLPPGRFRLPAGEATILFDGGARVELEGPATFDLVSARAGFLQGGSLRASVPPAATGFRIETPAARVVDLGTEFRVTVDDAGATEVRVLRGRVELTARAPAGAPAAQWLLGEGESQRVETPAPAAAHRREVFHGVLDVNGVRREFTDREEYEKARQQLMEQLPKQ